MEPNSATTYPELFNIATELCSDEARQRWTNGHKMEQLVTLIKKMKPEHRMALTGNPESASPTNNQSNRFARNWPKEVVDYLRQTPAHLFHLRYQGEWKIMQVYLSGEQSWQASVETETLALSLISMAGQTSYRQPKCTQAL